MVIDKILFLLLLIPYSLCTIEHDGVLGGKSELGSSVTDVTEKKEGSDYVAVDKNESAKVANVEHEKGESGSHGEKENVGKFENKLSEAKGYENNAQKTGQSEASQQGKNEFEQHNNGQYKKGFHRAGFSNNYHKDESGNKSSFYEDSDEEKGQRSFDNNGGHYGQKTQGSFRDGHQDNSYYGKDNAQRGFYDNGERYDNQRNHARGYDNNQYYDDRRKYMQDGLGRYYDRNGNEIYYRREQPYGYGGYGYRTYAPRPNYAHDYIDIAPRHYDREIPYNHAYPRNYRNNPSYKGYYNRQGYYSPNRHYDRNYRSDHYGTQYNDRYRRPYLPRGGYRR